MKKTLLALALAGAFIGSAAAADVTVYGLVDYGFSYQHTDGDVVGQDAGNTFQLRSGMNSGSRFGLKGSEDLGNGMKVGFVLENGFNADDGTIDNGGRLFGRESQMYIQGSFGTLSFGRVGVLASSNGSYSLLGQTSPFSSGWGDSVGQKFVTADGWGRMDNTITYQSPVFSGFQLHAQYSLKNDTQKDKGVEGRPSANRYGAVAATYTAQNLYLVAIVDTVDHGDTFSYLPDQKYAEGADDEWKITVGGNYDFQVAKVYLMAQYFMNAGGVGQKYIGSTGFGPYGYTYAETAQWNGADGFGIALGVGVPAFGGTVKAHVGYLDAESSDDYAGHPGELTRWNFALGYDYSLTKRTSVYSAVAYTRDDSTDYLSNGADINPSAVEVMAGMIHKF